MKSYVITILDNDKSVASAKRCIESGAKFGIEIEMWPAITPANTDVIEMAKLQGINPDGFREVYSRHENCIAAFLSHFSLWGKCYVTNEELQIFEHDAVITNPIPPFIKHNGCINLGKPSYGKYNTPSLLASNSLTSKRYFPGAHAYRVSPRGAKQLLAQAKIKARPTDVFLHLDTFPWLEEYYPWPVEAQDSFTTIQNVEGCRAKHNYGSKYEII
jgi:GR25 family glycosyltransferase involved in LPS biosynthesis